MLICLPTPIIGIESLQFSPQVKAGSFRSTIFLNQKYCFRNIKVITWVIKGGNPTSNKDWNVHEIKVDRGEKRFKDKVIVRDFWAEIDKILINKGYGRL